jgi:4-amino-4-deoxy-L-arabinose transferase-like glycosyltransferase
MTASASGVIGFARAASTDMPLAATFTIAMLAWYAWYESAGKRYLAMSYIFLGLAMLAKGPVAPFLAAVIVIVFATAKGDYRLMARTCWVPGIALFAVTALPWYVAVQLRNPEFFRVFILEHNLARFGKDLYHHTQPFWYYLPVALLGLVPWTVFVIATMAETIRAWWGEKKELFQSEDALPAFLVIWLIVPVVFFSFSESKLPGYIVPALPAGTLLLAEYVRRHVSDDDPPSLVLTVLHAMVAALPVVAALGELPEMESPVPPMPPDFDQAKLDRAVARMQSAQEVLSRVEVRRIEAQVRRAQQRLAVKTCKVVKLDQ